MPIDVASIRPRSAHPAPEPADAAVAARPSEPSAKPLVPGSVVAKALAAIWGGAPVTIVDAPPGSGKTAGVVSLVAHLTEHAGLRVLIQVVTRNQGVALAHRLVEQIAPKHVEVAIKNIEPGSLPTGLYSGTRSTKAERSRVTVKTVASCAFRSPSDFDVIVVDEAYQATYADIALGASRAPQIVCVGDPGQIGPVVTIDTSIWQHMADAPHRPAPEVLAGLEGAKRFSLDRTWRLGPASAAAIAPLYNFPFASACVPRRLVGAGEANRHRTYGEIEAIEVPDASSPDDLDVLRAVTDRVAELVHTRLYWPAAEGSDDNDSAEATRHTAESDIAVVLSRNSQVSIAKGLLAERGLDAVAVSTADRIQGAEYPIVVALDPAVGADGSNDHAMSNGRLCVMASRHTTHLSWVHDARWRKATAGRAVTAVRGRAVREALTSHAGSASTAPQSSIGRSATGKVVLRHVS
ncbi:MAG: AAA family ATPase [Actinomycetota bacterium]|jgi:hypothetical protein|nr:AAA family ATPase [Actinomycetota bacterium]